MTKPPASFEDIREVLDRALSSERGVKITCDAPGAAVHMIQRMNTFRKNDREVMLRVHGPDSPARHSVYDALIFKRVPAKTGNEVHVAKVVAGSIKVEEL